MSTAPTPAGGEGLARAPARAGTSVSWLVLAAALLTRLVWVIWVHPPHEHVFSDMAHYVYRARLVAGFEVEAGARIMVWQAWGTHAILAIPILLLGEGQSALEFAGLMWAGFSTGTVVYTHLLAVRVLPRLGGSASGPHWPALAVAAAVLVWIPLLSHAGFFVSETPYACALLAATHGAVRMIQDGRGAWATGLWSALAFVVRPQSALFFALLGLAWLVDRRRRGPNPGPSPGRASGEEIRPRGTWSRRVDGRAALAVTVPLVVVMLISMLRVWVHAGHLGGMSENGSMNLTAGRCHNVVTRSFSSEAHLAAFQAAGEPPPDRRISLPGFRALGRAGPDHPLALRPALGGEAIDLVGYVGDAKVHRGIRRRCYAATGIRGQLHYSVTNAALLWIVARPWPESSDAAAPELFPVAQKGRKIAAVLAPAALLGMIVALLGWIRARRRAGLEHDADLHELQRRAGLGLCALQLASLLIVAALFFGTPRLRTPYDPYALICLAGLVTWAVSVVRERVAPGRKNE